MHWEIVIDGATHPFEIRFFISEDEKPHLIFEFSYNRVLLLLKDKNQVWRVIFSGLTDKPVEKAIFEQINLIANIAQVLQGQYHPERRLHEH